MKKYIFLTLALLTAVSAMAQPKKSRVAQNNNSAATQKKAAQKVDRSSIMYPTAVAVPEEVTWRRDIHRELDLRLDENAPLYYPDMPKDGEQNLFFTLFRLLNVGRIPAYNYKTDGTEHFDRANRMHFRDMLDRYEIHYEVDSARRAINVADADVPGSEVLSYFVKESSYYDQNTATFHTRIVALCPVLHRASDEFSYESMTLEEGDEDVNLIQKYPMFWVKFEDIEPYISKQMIMVSNINNASKMSVADYLATNKYKGKIYMTTNMQNKAIMDYCKTDSDVVKEQKRLEKEMTDFEKHIWTPPVDSATIAKRDSIAAAEAAAKNKKKNRRAARNQEAEETETVEKENAEPTGARSTARRAASSEATEQKKTKSTGRITARRQRH